MRILLAGDTHGDLPWFRVLFRIAEKEKCDRIFVLGDFGYWEHEVDGRRFLDKLDANAELKQIQVYFLDGNHDKTSLLLRKYGQQENEEDEDDEGFLNVRPNIHYARRGHQWNWDGVEFIALGGAYSVDKQYRLDVEAKYGKPESIWFPEEEMTDDEMAEILRNAAGVDVVLAHDKPLASEPSWNRKSFEECLPNQRRLQGAVKQLQPQRFFHGHLHFRYTDRIWVEELERAAGLTGRLPLDCRVEGLNCNPDVRDFPGPLSDSYYVFDTETELNAEND